jgi:MFS family permease
MPAGKPPSKPMLFLASCVGTSMEWYDYFIFGTAAALIFGDLFYPEFSPFAATLAAFSSFAVGFVVRPLGAMVFGHVGDRAGRKVALVLTLVITGVATALIGLLPTYAAIGVAAPILLVMLRLVQGFAVGGEWGGAVLVSSEHAPAGREIFYGSFAQLGLPIGVLLSNAAFLMVAGLPREEFASWGWRIPFLLSVALVLFGFFIRRRLEDSAEFRSAETAGRPDRIPVRALFAQRRTTVFVAVAVAIAPTAIGNASVVYMLSYGTSVVGIERSTMLLVISVSTFVGIPAMLLAARLADYVGPRRIFAVGSALAVIWIYPLFLMVGTGDAVNALIGMVIIGIGLGFMSGPQGGLFAHAFEPRIRYSGMSIAYQLAGVVGGALTPIIAATLFETTGSVLAIATYLAALTVMSAVALPWLRPADPTTAEMARLSPSAPPPVTTGRGWERPINGGTGFGEG